MAQRQTEGAAYRLRIEGSESRVEKPEEFEYSYFQEEYKNILRAVWKVVESNENDRKRMDRARHSNRYRPDIRIHNIVPIIGRRGSGKSTILHSVAGLLHDRSGRNQEGSQWIQNYFNTGGRFEDTIFFVTESIDGSLLEQNEDIFPTILVQMKKMLQDLSSANRGEDRDSGRYSGGSFQLRELYKKLEKLYKNARQMSVNSSEFDRWNETTPLSSMDQLSNSLSLRQDFRCFLTDFLDYYAEFQLQARSSSERFRSENCYLVIPIDDLDLNIGHGYEMLEKLHRYMMLPNVIVLMAFDQEQFRRLCEKEFYNMIPTFDSRMNAAAPKIEELARQYLEKVMPLSQRTYVPSLDTRSEVIVEQEDNEYSPKFYVFRLLFQKLGMRMDVDGEKRHFLERRNLRDYVNLVNLLQGMESPFQYNNKKFHFRQEVYRHNYRIFREEIFHGMVSAWLSDTTVLSQYRVDTATTTSTYTHYAISPKEQFHQIAVNTANLIPRSFRNFFFSVAKEGRVAEVGSELRNLVEAMDEYDFSYGEILHIIYHYGRISNENKKLIHSLLAFYSLVLNKSYMSQAHHAKSEEGESCRKAFLLLINGSVVGSWANDMVPKVRLQEKYYGSGLRRVQNMSKAFSFQEKDFLPLFSDSDLELEEKTKALFHAILIVGMLFDFPKYKMSKQLECDSFVQIKDSAFSDIRKEIGKLSGSIGAEIGSLSFRPVRGEGTFSFLGFVSTVFQYGVFLNEKSSEEKKKLSYLEDLLGYTADYITKNSQIFSVAFSPDKVLDKVKEIKKEFKTWNDRYFGFALPFYDIDVCYNLIKRLRQDQFGRTGYINNNNGENEEHEYLFDSFIETYQALANRLSDNDSAYQEACKIDFGESGSHPQYADAFRSCPFIKWLGIEQEIGGKKNAVSEEAEFTRELTKHLLEKVFRNMTQDGVSVSYVDGPSYQPIKSYDD